jgi:carboxyl-terminal processing protease
MSIAPENNKYVPIDGIWQSIGYNKCFEFSAGRFSIHDLSAISCVPSMEGSLDDFYRVFDRIQVDPAGLLHFYARGGITRYSLKQLDDQNPLCAPLRYELQEDPGFNFEVFWHYFEENYAFFELRQLDWQQVYRHYRPRIHTSTSRAELAGIFTEILLALNDSHATLSIPGQTISTRKPHALIRQWQKEFNSTQFLELYPAGIPRLFTALNHSLLNGSGKSALNGQILWGKIDAHTGYLCVFSMMDMYADFSLLHFAGFEVTNQAYLDALGVAIDAVIAGLADVDSLVVDVRFNPGGHDAAGRVIASRFTDQRRMAFTKQVRQGVQNTPGVFSTPQAIYLEPEGTRQYTRPILLLTSEATASAAEAFVYFMMALPHVTRIGGRTRGVLSDMLLMRLPHGWEISISNELYRAVDGICYESSGIPPHIEAPVFNEENFYECLPQTVRQAATLSRENGE